MLFYGVVPAGDLLAFPAVRRSSIVLGARCRPGCRRLNARYRDVQLRAAVPGPALDVRHPGRLPAERSVPDRWQTLYRLNPHRRRRRRLPLGAARGVGARRGRDCDLDRRRADRARRSGSFYFRPLEHTVRRRRLSPARDRDRRVSASATGWARHHPSRPQSGRRAGPRPDASRAPARPERPPTELWALRDVLVRGRAAARSLGVIGRNGAGKSTLLKMLPRITGPTSGPHRALRPGRLAARSRHRLPPRAHRAARTSS